MVIFHSYVSLPEGIWSSKSKICWIQNEYKCTEDQCCLDRWKGVAFPHRWGSWRIGRCTTDARTAACYVFFLQPPILAGWIEVEKNQSTTSERNPLLLNTPRIHEVFAPLLLCPSPHDGKTQRTCRRQLKLARQDILIEEQPLGMLVVPWSWFRWAMGETRHHTWFPPQKLIDTDTWTKFMNVNLPS